MNRSISYQKGFIPYALAALLIGLVGGFSTVLGPAFVQDIGIAYNNTTWTALAQAMSTAACAPILGKVGDVIGRKKTLLLGIAVFTLGNLLSVLAGSLIFMMVARFIVGIGTAAMGPVILAYIATEFPQEKVAKGFSQYMLLSSASVIIGPTIGGLIVSAYGWRAMLWVCVFICVGTFVACTLTSKNQPSAKKALQNFDLIGAVLILIFFSLLLCVPSFGQNFGWTSLPFLAVLIASLISLAGLILAERKAAYIGGKGDLNIGVAGGVGGNDAVFIHCGYFLVVGGEDQLPILLQSGLRSQGHVQRAGLTCLQRHGPYVGPQLLCLHALTDHRIADAVQAVTGGGGDVAHAGLGGGVEGSVLGFIVGIHGAGGQFAGAFGDGPVEGAVGAVWPGIFHTAMGTAGGPLRGHTVSTDDQNVTCTVGCFLHKDLTGDISFS